VAAACGLATPRSLVTNDPDAFASFFREHDGQIISKTLQARRADVEGELRFAFTHAVRRRDGTNLLALRNGPVLLQERVEKRSEIRATLVDGEVFAGEVESQDRAATRVDWRRATTPPLRWRRHTLPADVVAALIALHARLGLCFGCVDLVLTPKGEYVFLETNPLGDWLFIEDRLDLPITEAVAAYLCPTASA
jgi:glutathione synthase/RimK-type ligase-like ATP-grasp enzyme